MNEDRQALLDALAAPRIPPVPLGWVAWLTTALVLLLVGAAVVVMISRYRRRRRLLAWRPEADAVLRTLRSELVGDPLDACASRDWLAEASALARRLMLVARPRTEIASLTGSAWLQQLRQLDAMDGLDETELLLLVDGSFRRELQVEMTALEHIADALGALVYAANTRSLQTHVASVPQA